MIIDSSFWPMSKAAIYSSKVKINLFWFVSVPIWSWTCLLRHYWMIICLSNAQIVWGEQIWKGKGLCPTSMTDKYLGGVRTIHVSWGFTILGHSLSLSRPHPQPSLLRQKHSFFFFPQKIFLAQFVPLLLPFLRILPNYFSISYKLKFFFFLWSSVQNDAKFCLVSKQNSLLSDGDMFSLCSHSAWIVLKYSW